MKKQVQALTLMWPNGIPTPDYERALRLAAEFSGAEQAPPKPQRNEVTRRGAIHQPNTSISPEMLEKIRQILSTGRATVAELVDASGAAETVVRIALRVLKAVDAGRGTRSDGGHGRRPILWALPKERTP